jgi:predicted flavoprotein YhiN
VGPTSVDVVVLGGGAAGLWCAAAAGRRGRRVLVVGHKQRVGKNFQLSGGGGAHITKTRGGAEHIVS